MTKRLLTAIVLAAVGAVVARKARARRATVWTMAPAPTPLLVAETPQPRTEEGSAPAEALEPEEALQAKAVTESDTTADKPHAHTRRPSPVPRDRPLWTPPADAAGSGRHAAPQED